MSKIERIEDSENRTSPLRVWRRKGNRTKSPSIRVKCGCCNQEVVIYFDKEPTGNPSTDILEINGVNGTVDQWKKVLLPLLDLDSK